MLAVPLGIIAAIYISEIASPKLKTFFKNTIEILAGIPSVVYGFFGLTVLTSFLKNLFNQPSGVSWLAGSIILGIMALPTIISVSEDALAAIPYEYREASLGMGGTKWQTITKIIVPAASPGISSAIILGMGRALGETMAVIMVCGNSAVIPTPITNVFSPIRTITSTLGQEIPEIAAGSTHYLVLS